MSVENLLILSKWVLYSGTFIVFLGSVGVSHFTSKNDKLKGNKIDSLVSGNKRLEQSSQELLGRIDIYQKDLSLKQEEIDKLKLEAARSKRGLISLWDFNGTHRDNSAGSTSICCW